MMTLLPLAIAVIGFIVIFKMAQRSTPTPTAKLVDGDLDAVEFFWRPG